MQPYYEHAGITIYHGDCREIMPALGTFDALVTDPPYGMNFKFSGQGSGKAATGSRQSRFKAQTIINDDVDFNPSHLLDHKKIVLWGFHHYPQYLARGSVLVWVKKYPDAFGSFLSDADLAWMNSGHGVYCSPVINPASFQKDRQHPTQKPVDLMLWCIKKAKIEKTETVLDPYAGSGSTLIAAKQGGFKAVGIELEEKYCEIAARRLSQEVLNFPD